MTKEFWIKIGKGAIVAVGGALLTYIVQLIPGLELGSYTPIVVAVLSVLVNMGRKFLEGLSR